MVQKNIRRKRKKKEKKRKKKNVLEVWARPLRECSELKSRDLKALRERNGMG